ncbi:hypothetical protein NliqN6_4643 [Naganishia liquefaciens]|uniref:Aminotransferase class I/classII large domain-containing protein n=1 Tax=Naganishia liquefaciens TaxID=104408 RepID=A0A8H3YI56_9TREE|nr:hypothetical protein NliqN6_4643 [Naganishia liquefaciens]
MTVTTQFTQQSPMTAAKASATAVATKEWSIKASPVVGRSKNKIRSVIAGLDLSQTKSDKPLINLGLGDPTVFGLHDPPKVAIEAMQDALIGGNANGYVPGTGLKEACQAVADYHKRWDGVDYAAEDVTLTHGTSHALDMCFSVMASPEHNVLIPRPGFPAYGTLLGNVGCEVREYEVLADREWECDLEAMEQQIDENTAFILITNPSNPCGNNMTPQHLQDIVNIAERHRVPIIADEIYGHMHWSEWPFVPLASLAKSAPVLTLSGLSKRFLLPGWRFGWIALHDSLNVAGAIRNGLHAWGNRFMGPNTLVQKSLGRILSETPDSWYDEVTRKLEYNAQLAYSNLSIIPGLYCTFPTAAMYLLLGVDIKHFPEFPSDVEFCSALVQEQNLFCIPGESFSIANHMRLVLAAPSNVLQDSCERLREFCAKHYVA